MIWEGWKNAQANFNSVPSKFSAGATVSFTDLLGAVHDSVMGSRTAAASAGVDITSEYVNFDLALYCLV